MHTQTRRIGASGEQAALLYLKRKGYRILATNYRNRFGEIDIIARDKDTLAFIEVKTRYSSSFGLPQEAVLASKQKKISYVAVAFLKERNLLDAKARFDVVAIVYDACNNPTFNLIKNAFELDGRFTY